VQVRVHVRASVFGDLRHQEESEPEDWGRVLTEVSGEDWEFEFYEF